LGDDLPLDRVNGEKGDHKLLGFGHRVAPNAKWRDTEFFAHACKMAVESFRKTRKILPRLIKFDDDEWMVQEYPIQGAIVFFFQKRLAGRDFYFAAPFWLSKKVQAELATVGRWGTISDLQEPRASSIIQVRG
jgi:hypothetical protein